MYGLSLKGHGSTGYFTQVPSWEPHKKRKSMTNNTTNETSNETASENMTGNVTENEVSESGMLDGLMDALSDSPELFILCAALMALVAYTAPPSFKALVMPYLKNYDTQIVDLMDKHLTAAQAKAYEKLDEAAQKHVKDAVLRNVIMSVYDQNDDKFVGVVKTEVKEALAGAKKL
tara:strand:- start:77 stop:601 length:525 start_codon:yes stop_codon:yes gene_type:complete